MTTSKKPSFQEIILRLQQYWSDKGCALLQPYDMEVGAARRKQCNRGRTQWF